MGAALYIVLEKEIPGLDTFVNGKRLSQSEKLLAETATRLGIRPLMEFFSQNPEEARDFFEGEGMDDVEIPDEQWFSAEEGLRTVQAFLREADSAPELKDSKEDLLQFERVLGEAQKNEVRWHLAVDY